ncbi:hypothetical protein T01_8624 [Trichinella spiralis]|uniref:Peptidase A2 domain-containing protein n=1 Tax=Trichinella spiralis TaxID=6334 RepID=A0A0V1C0S6_TRISP|nr:hypothetical protein T01_8624 [Trichinella spiralis]
MCYHKLLRQHDENSAHLTSDNGFVANILVFRAGEVGSAEVEPSGSRASGVENESFANEEKGRNPPFDFEKIERQIWTGLRNRFLSLRAQVESSMAVKEPTDSVGREDRKFEVSVHQQVDLSNATKFTYLRGCPTGVALDALRGLSAANQGYELGVQRLKERFDRPQVAVREHILRFFHNLSRTSDLSDICDECHKRWDKLTMEDGSLVADLTVFLRFLQEQFELSDTARRTKDLRLEEKRSICALEKPRSYSKRRGCDLFPFRGRSRLRFLSEAAHACGVREIETGESPEAAGDSNPLSAFSASNQGTSPRPARVIVAGREIPMAEYKSFAVLVMHANLTSEKLRKINRFQRIKTMAYSAVGPGMTVTYLLDTGAEYSFVREDAASTLGVFREMQLVMVEGFGGATHEHPSSQPEYRALSSGGADRAESLLSNSGFEDPDERSDEVHVVIGIDYYYRFLGDAIRRGRPGDPVAVETVLGWIICGPVNPHPAPKTVAAFSAVVEPKVEDLLRSFWEIEGMGVPFRSESHEVELQWRVWKLELNELHCIAMSRAYFPFSPAEASRLELHGFGDASEAAYAAVVYLRAVKTPDDVQVKELALDVEACHCWSDNKVTVSPPQDVANVINPGRYSSFERLIRVTAWCRRFRHSTTLPASSRRTGTGLTLDELKEAERIWIRQEQIHAFSSRELLDKAMTKMLCGLNPFLDEFGVLRVGGRLGRAQLEEETKFPALLPRKGMIVDLLIRREHNRQLHAGVALGKRWASWNPQADERLIDELTYDQRFELRS